MDRAIRAKFASENDPAAAQAEAPRGNYYTEPYSAPLRQLIAAKLGVPERLGQIKPGSAVILRQACLL